MDHIDILQEILRYIDIHIKEEMNVEKLAHSDGNPWYFGEEPVYQWDFLR